MTYKVTVSGAEQKYKVTVDSDYSYSASTSYPSNLKVISGITSNTYNTKSKTTTSQKATFSYTVELMPQNLDELDDVEIVVIGSLF